jgi:hypothetical protein
MAAVKDEARISLLREPKAIRFNVTLWLELIDPELSPPTIAEFDLRVWSCALVTRSRVTSETPAPVSIANT